MTEYESSKYGYLPHADQTKVVCPKCGNSVFECYAQSVVIGAKVWCYEHMCVKCKHIMGVEVIRND